MFKAGLGGAMQPGLVSVSDLREGWNWAIFKVPSKQNHSAIL